MKKCIHLDLNDKLIIRTTPDFKIYFVNDNFTHITGINAEQALLKNLTEILPFSMADLFHDVVKENIKENEPSYYILKGKTKHGDCYWGLMRITPFYSKLNGEKRYLFEIKMLPHNAEEESEKIYDVIEKVYLNAGHDFAKKYFEGYLEDQNTDYEGFIFKTLGTNKKKIKKYFEIT